MAEKAPPGGQPGVEADHPIIDPTKNVLDLVEAANKRQDDLRKAERRFFMAHLRHVEKIGKLRAEHQSKMDTAESARIDSIRQIDIQNTATAAAQALTAIQTLAANNATRDEQVRTLVTTTATGLATTNAAANAEFNKRLTTLEQTSFQEMGKQKVADPQMERLSSVVEQLARSRATDTGQKQGLSDGWKMLIAALGMWSLLQGLGVFAPKAVPGAAAAPQIIFVPAPPGTLLPSTPPQPVPGR